jgi:hypothetical protein
MPATMPQTTIDQTDALEPTVIEATVNVSLGADPGTYHHEVAALAAAGSPGSQWKVIWTVTASPGLSVFFNTPGIIIPKPGTSLPGGVQVTGISGSPTQQQLEFTNNVLDVNVIRYDLDFEVSDTEHNKLTRANLIFDPTIAVVKEPMDG